MATFLDALRSAGAGLAVLAALFAAAALGAAWTDRRASRRRARR